MLALPFLCGRVHSFPFRVDLFQGRGDFFFVGRSPHFWRTFREGLPSLRRFETRVGFPLEFLSLKAGSNFDPNSPFSLSPAMSSIQYCTPVGPLGVAECFAYIYISSPPFVVLSPSLSPGTTFRVIFGMSLDVVSIWTHFSRYYPA